jgi:hypothetical protein
MADLHSRFLSFLHRIEAHAKFCFRRIRCADRLADFVAEVVALAWKWFVRLEQRGKDVMKFVSAIAAYAVKAVKCGQRITRMERAKDAMNPRTQRRHGFRVEPLPFEMPRSSAFAPALTDNAVTPPPDAAAFRIDFPSWLGTLAERDQRVAEALMMGERPYETAERFGMSRSRVSQLRRAWSEDWTRFHGEDIAVV